MDGGFNMKINEGMIPTALGAIVTGTGATMLKKKVAPKTAAGVIGFGLAHVVLGSIDLVQHRNKIDLD